MPLINVADCKLSTIIATQMRFLAFLSIWGSHEKLRESLTQKVTRVRGARSLAHFHYGSLTWHFCGARNRDKLELLNKRILRFIFNDANSSYDALLKKAKTTSLYRGRNHKMLIVVFKSLFVSAYPKYLKKEFCLRLSKYFLRGNNVLSLPERLNRTAHQVRSCKALELT